MLDENYTYTYPINLANLNLPKEIFFDDLKFTIKEEFHMTVIGNRTGKLIKLFLEKYPDLKDFIENQIKSYDWNISLSGPYYVIENEKPNQSELEEQVKEYRYSIIQKIDSPDLLNLFQVINQKYPELSLETPFPHVTLYTFNDKKGIAIYTEEEFEKYKKSEFIPEIINNLI